MTRTVKTIKLKDKFDDNVKIPLPRRSHINEAAFKPNEWSKHDYKYASAVINKILIDKKIHTGVSGDTTVDLSNLTKEDMIALDNINRHISDAGSYAAFTNIIKKYNLKWSDINKGIFSGHVGRGSEGQIYESLVCHLINLIDYTDDDINAWHRKFTKNVRNERWVQSCKISAKKILDFVKEKYGDNDYIALHVDGQNFYDSIGHNFITIASIFRGKYNRVSLTNGMSKDKWNPADIVLINRYFDTDKFFSELNEHYNDPTAMNVVLASYLGSGDVIPISLKMISEYGRIYGHNTDIADIADEHSDITSIQIKLGVKYEKNSTSGNLIIIGLTSDNNESLEVQVRAQTGNDNLSIEAKLPNNKMARGGKGITYIKKTLGLTNNSYYKNIQSNDELFMLFQKYGFEDETGKKITEIPAGIKDVDLYKRVCFRGFFGLLEKYEEHLIQTAVGTERDEYIRAADPEFLPKFGQFIWAACTQCPGAYLILK